MKETLFQQHLRSGLKAQGVFIQKITDKAIGDRKPFDFYACVRGKFWAIEAKFAKVSDISQKSLKVVDESDMQSHQVSQLQEVVAAGGRGVIAIGVYEENRAGAHTRRAWILEVSTALRHLHEGWTLALLEEATGKQGCWELTWVPNIGWTFQPQSQPAH